MEIRKVFPIFGVIHFQLKMNLNLSMRFIYFLGILIFVNTNLQGQESDTTVLTKGRIFSSLYGTLTNQQTEVSTSGTLVSNGYTLGTKSGKFLKDNWVSGINFSLSKTEFSNSFANLDNEELLLGLWTRFYFGHRGDASLYAEITPNYTSIFRVNTVSDPTTNTLVLNEETSGSGFGLIPGIGFTYLINKNVGFGMSLSYSMAWLDIDTTDFLTNQTKSGAYNIYGMQFSFNFEVYLDQFFF
jgi:outer membrane protein W